MTDVKKQKTIKLFQWVVTPIFIVVVVNYSFVFLLKLYATPQRIDIAWERAWDMAGKDKIDFIFLGSSRTAVSVSAEIFSERIASYKNTDKLPTTLNLGTAWTTMAEYYFYLRNLWERYPKNLNGCVVFLEAPGGVPSHAGWGDQWFATERPDFITPLLSPKDLLGLWKTKISFEQKIRITLLWSMRKAVIVQKRLVIRGGMLRRGKIIVKKVFNFIDRREYNPVSQQDRITAAGGVVNDLPEIERIRERARIMALKSKKDQKPVLDWEKTVLFGILKFVSDNGGRAVILNMPLSSTERIPYETQIRRSDKKLLFRQIQKWRVLFIDTKIKVSDDDFPDLWHLRKARVREFTQSIADKYIQSIL